MTKVSSAKRCQDEMLDMEEFYPDLNSTSVDSEKENWAKVIHDLVFQKYGPKRRMHRSNRLKVLREFFYPDAEQTNVENIRADDKTSVSTGSQWFSEDDDAHYESIDEHIYESIESFQPQLHQSCTYSIGSNDISELLSVRSPNFFNDNQHLSSSECDDNNNTVINHESTKVSSKISFNLSQSIRAQEIAMQEFAKVLSFGRRKHGFVGSVPHIQAEKGLLTSTLRHDALIATLNNDRSKLFRPQSNLKGRITVGNIKCDTNVIEESRGLLPCYYMCVLQNNATVLSSEVIAPDQYGIVDFKDQFVFENVPDNFTINLMLFKLQLKPATSENIGWRISLRKRHFELPKLELVGNQEVSVSNLKKTVFHFGNDILYADFIPCVHLENRMETHVIIQKIVRKSKFHSDVVSHRRWCVLDGTDLKVYRCVRDVGYLEPLEIVSLAYCKSCVSFDYLTLTLEFVHAQFGRTLYLAFEHKCALIDWTHNINLAIFTAKAFGL